MPTINQININDAKIKIDDGNINIVDIRDPASYATGHIANATHLSDNNVQEFIEKTDKDLPLIVYCYHGNSSQGAAAYFQEQGFKEVYSMAGGFESWRFTHPFETD
jgi:thiosulfate sulfurtransferase